MTASSQVPFYSEAELSKLSITARDSIAMIEKLIAGRAAGDVWSAPKASVAVPDDRYIMTTLAAADDPPYLAVKSLLLNPRNPGRGEPLMNSVVTLQDSETGRPLALLDGNWITAVRTAALSAVAARRMARPDAETIAFVGCGVQARSHLQVFSELFPLNKIIACGRGRPNIEALCTLAGEMGLDTVVAGGPDDALGDADIIVSSVTREPGAPTFVDAAHVKAGAFAAITDLARPWHEASLAHFDRIIIDDRGQEAKMKDPMVPSDLISGDVSELVLETVPGRENDTERAAFVFRGFGLGDFALAALAYDKLR